jgi:glycosyltransferase involved in cell wall biosynthesis
MSQAASLLFIAPTPDLKYGGEASHFELIKGAKQRGYAVHVLLPGPGEFARELRRVGINCTIARYSYWDLKNAFSKDISNFTVVGRIIELTKTYQVDCVITNTLHLPWGALAAAATGLPHVWIARETPVKQFAYLKDKYDFIAAYSNLLIANSKELASHMKRMGLAQTKYFFSYVDVSGIELNRSLEEPRIVNVGHIHNMKNQKLLVEAAGILQKRDRLKYPVVFIGGYAAHDPYYSEIKGLVRELGLLGKVQFKGYRKNPYEYIGRNDIFVQTSLLESIGRATTEAMKMGLICLGADIPGTREAFALGGGILFDGCKATALAAALEGVMNDIAAAEARAKTARSRALRNMSEEASHEPFFTGLADVLGEANPRQELHHLSADFTALETIINNYEHRTRNYEHRIHEYQLLIASLENHLNNIINSRSWKAVLAMRKYLRRGRRKIDTD